MRQLTGSESPPAVWRFSAKSWGDGAFVVAARRDRGEGIALGIARFEAGEFKVVATTGPIRFTDDDDRAVPWGDGLFSKPPRDVYSDGATHFAAALRHGPGPSPGYVEYRVANRVDLAPFRVGGGAIGLRVLWIVSQASDARAFYEALFLFERRGRALRRIAALPMSSYIEYGGWDEDRKPYCRNVESENVLEIRARPRDARPGLVLWETLTRRSRAFRWSDAQQLFEPVR